MSLQNAREQKGFLRLFSHVGKRVKKNLSGCFSFYRKEVFYDFKTFLKSAL